MLLGALIVLAVISIILIIVSVLRAPEGYEDKTGFHKGKEPIDKKDL